VPRPAPAAQPEHEEPRQGEHQRAGP
jgi:hypothetical protein